MYLHSISTWFVIVGIIIKTGPNVHYLKAPGLVSDSLRMFWVFVHKIHEMKVKNCKLKF